MTAATGESVIEWYRRRTAEKHRRNLLTYGTHTRRGERELAFYRQLLGESLDGMAEGLRALAS